MTSAKRTAVCCLSSLNLEKYEDWKDTTIVEDLIRYLDNVLEYFIRLAPKELKRAVHSASKERALGLGTLGFHSLLQSKMIPFESRDAVSLNYKIFSEIEKRAITSSKQLAKERGEALIVKVVACGEVTFWQLPLTRVAVHLLELHLLSSLGHPMLS